MTEKETIIAQAQSAEAIQAQAVAAEAIERARMAQVEAAMKKNQAETTEMIFNGLRRVLTEGEEGTKMLLLKKVPLLCTDMLKMKSDLQWIKWLLMGMVGGVGVLTIALLVK